MVASGRWWLSQGFLRNLYGRLCLVACPFGMERNVKRLPFAWTNAGPVLMSERYGHYFLLGWILDFFNALPPRREVPIFWTFHVPCLFGVRCRWTFHNARVLDEHTGKVIEENRWAECKACGEKVDLMF